MISDFLLTPINFSGVIKRASWDLTIESSVHSLFENRTHDSIQFILVEKHRTQPCIISKVNDTYVMSVEDGTKYSITKKDNKNQVNCLLSL